MSFNPIQSFKKNVFLQCWSVRRQGNLARLNSRDPSWRPSARSHSWSKVTPLDLESASN